MIKVEHAKRPEIAEKISNDPERAVMLLNRITVVLAVAVYSDPF